MADIEIQDDFQIPTKHRGVRGKEKYPFGALKIGQGFEVDISHLKHPHSFHTIALHAQHRHGIDLDVTVNGSTRRAYVRRSA